MKKLKNILRGLTNDFFYVILKLPEIIIKEEIVMKIKEKFINLKEKTKKSSGRFPVAFVNIAMCFVLLLVCVWTEEMNDVMAKLIFLTGCSAVFSAGTVLAYECFGVKKEKIPWFVAVCPILLEAVLFVLSFILEDAVYLRAMTGILIATVFLCFYFITQKGKLLSNMASSIKNSAFSAFVSLVILVGGLICILAFVTLVYNNYSFTDKIIFTLLSFCASIVPALILVYLPSVYSPDEKPGKGYKGVTVYAGLSIYFVLSAILYLYLVKIIFSTELPSGGVNPFVTTASAAYIFFIFAIGIFEEDNAYVRFFTKFGGYLMIPLVIVQCITLGIRIYHYGLTAARVISICFIIVTVMFIAGSVIRKKIGLGLPCIAAAVITLAVTCTPFNIDSIALYNQKAILKNALTESGMLKDGVIDLNAEISDEQHGKISSSYRYLTDYSDNLPEYLGSDEQLKQDFDNEFGYGYTREENYLKYCHYINTKDFASDFIDISEFSSIKRIDEEQFKPCKPGEGLILNYTDAEGNTYESDLESWVRELYEENKNGWGDIDASELYYLDDGTAMYLEYMNFYYNSFNDEITEFEISGYKIFK